MKKVGRLLALSAAAVCSLGAMTSCRTMGFKVGLLCLHGQTSTYDNNFIKAFEHVCKEENLKEGDSYEIRTDVAEDYNEIYTATKEWAEDGYSMIFADSFGHQYGVEPVANEYKDGKTIFCHATGTTTTLRRDQKDTSNFHTAFANIYEGRYLAGVAAGAKMAEDVLAGKYTADQAKIGYIGALPYAEVISGYTSFFLGAKKGFEIFESKDHRKIDQADKDKINMVVTYTNSWYDYKKERESAISLIKNGCKLISQHADSMGAPQVCDSEGIPNVTYNIDTLAKFPNTYLYGCKINWRPYFRDCIQSAKSGEDTVQLDYTGDLVFSEAEDGTTVTVEDEDASEGAVKAGPVSMLKEGNLMTAEIKKAVKQEAYNLMQYVNSDTDGVTPAGYIFNLENFKVGGSSLPDYYEADVIDDGTYAPDTNVIRECPAVSGFAAHKYFAESEYDEDAADPKDMLRSAPFFAMIIDGISPIE